MCVCVCAASLFLTLWVWGTLARWFSTLIPSLRGRGRGRRVSGGGEREVGAIAQTHSPFGLG